LKFKPRNSEALAALICGNVGSAHPGPGEEPAHCPYRSSSYITAFFQELDTEWVHDGSTRHHWVADVLDSMLAEPHDGPTHPPEIICRVVDQLMSPGDALNEGADRPNALRQLNEVLAREGFEAFYGEDKHCYLRHIGTNTVTVLQANPHRPFTEAETRRRRDLASFLDRCSEDRADRGSAPATLSPTGLSPHHLRRPQGQGAGIRQRRLDALHPANPALPLLRDPGQEGQDRRRGGGTKSGQANVAELHNQALMMLAHEIFDPETNKRVLVDHAFIVAGGESPRPRATGSAMHSTPPSGARSCSSTARTS